MAVNEQQIGRLHIEVLQAVLEVERVETFRRFQHIRQKVLFGNAWRAQAPVPFKFKQRGPSHPLPFKLKVDWMEPIGIPPILLRLSPYRDLLEQII